MKVVNVNNQNIEIVENTNHEFLISTNEVAKGYGCTPVTIRNNQKNNKDELLEGKHWIRLEVQTRGGKQKVIHWTKKGVVRLGFFIKSKQAKEFRDWAEDYIVEGNSLPSENIQQLQDRIKLLEGTIMQQNRLVAHKPQPEINFTELLDDMRFSLENQMRIMLQNFEANYRGVIDTQILSIHRDITRKKK